MVIRDRLGWPPMNVVSRVAFILSERRRLTTIYCCDYQGKLHTRLSWDLRSNRMVVLTIIADHDDAIPFDNCPGQKRPVGNIVTNKSKRAKVDFASGCLFGDVAISYSFTFLFR